MSEKNQTITGGLGLNEGYFDEAKDLVLKKLKDLDTISDALESVAEVVRDEELGETNFRVSDYEKKLILCGFVMGCFRTESEMSRKLDELKMVMSLMAMSKEIGKDKEGNPILGGVINGENLPPELRDLLDKLSGGDGDED
jgi:TPP-dependent 2-oxoacid decarboxylase